MDLLLECSLCTIKVDLRLLKAIKMLFLQCSETSFQSSRSYFKGEHLSQIHVFED